jgi:hypothetical protein
MTKLFKKRSSVVVRVFSFCCSRKHSFGEHDFAAGHTYTSAVVLSLERSTKDTGKVAATGAVCVLIGGTLVPGVVVEYTYRSATHDVVIDTMTLGTQVGALQFGVATTTPSGTATYEVISSGHTVVAVPNTVTLAQFVDGFSLLASEELQTHFTFSHTDSAINNTIGNFESGASSGIVTVASTPKIPVKLAATFAANRVLGATVTATGAQQTFTFTFSTTQTTASCVVHPGAIYTLPTCATGVATADDSAAPFKLVVGNAVRLKFTFDRPLPCATLFSATVNGSTLLLGEATVSGSSIILPFTATAVIDYTFAFVVLGKAFVFNKVLASEVLLRVNVSFGPDNDRKIVGDLLYINGQFDAPIGTGQWLGTSAYAIQFPQVNLCYVAYFFSNHVVKVRWCGGSKHVFRAKFILDVVRSPSLPSYAWVGILTHYATHSSLIPANVRFCTNRKIVGNTIYLDGNALIVVGHWITNNAYAALVYSNLWTTAFFYDDHTVRDGVWQYANEPTEMNIVENLVYNRIYDWTGNLPSYQSDCQS